MGDHRDGRRTLTGFFGLSAGIVLLFGQWRVSQRTATTPDDEAPSPSE